MTVLEVLKKAKEQYERCGVNRKPLDDECCAVTALDDALDSGGLLRAQVFQVFREANGIDGIAHFNDSHTKEEVVKAFSKAIEYEVGRG